MQTNLIRSCEYLNLLTHEHGATDTITIPKRDPCPGTWIDLVNTKKTYLHYKNTLKSTWWPVGGKLI